MADSIQFVIEDTLERVERMRQIQAFDPEAYYDRNIEGWVSLKLEIKDCDSVRFGVEKNLLREYPVFYLRKKLDQHIYVYRPEAHSLLNVELDDNDKYRELVYMLKKFF